MITIDAISGEKTIAKKIIEQDADYLLAEKNNHPKLRDVHEITSTIGADIGLAA